MLILLNELEHQIFSWLHAKPIICKIIRTNLYTVHHRYVQIMQMYNVLVIIHIYTQYITGTFTQSRCVVWSLLLLFTHSTSQVPSPYLDTWSGFEAAKTAPWPSQGLHHFGKFLEPSDEWAGDKVGHFWLIRGRIIKKMMLKWPDAKMTKDTYIYRVG